MNPNDKESAEMEANSYAEGLDTTKIARCGYLSAVRESYIAGWQAHEARTKALVEKMAAVLKLDGGMTIEEKMETIISIGPPHCLKVEIAAEVLRNIRETLTEHDLGDL